MLGECPLSRPDVLFRGRDCFDMLDLLISGAGITSSYLTTTTIEPHRSWHFSMKLPSILSFEVRLIHLTLNILMNGIRRV